jgi:hypothetical protein
MATGGPVGKLCYLDGLPAKPKIEIDELPAKRARRLGDQSDDAAVRNRNLDDRLDLRS